MVVITYNYTVATGAYKPTYKWGAPHCMVLAQKNLHPIYPEIGSIYIYKI